jgi:D-beta-D-heptose 7-phosphate kinase/D-beta-D-heptose 1-phosphate adenosyltransferase
MIIGLTSGCFDLIHFGHIHYLQRCRKLCDRLIVAVDSDSMIKTVKGPTRPIMPEEERLMLVNSLGCIDAAFIMRGLAELARAAKAFHVNKLFKHEGFKVIDNVYGLGNGAELVIVPDIPGLVSTTRIIERIMEKMS